MKLLTTVTWICVAFGLAGCSRKPSESGIDEKSPAEDITKSMAETKAKPIIKRTMDDLVVDLLKAHPNLKAGIELVPTANHVISMPLTEEVRETEDKAVQRVSEVIASHTDYECSLYKQWLIITPRLNKTQFDAPSTPRICAAPSAKGVPVNDFLRLIKGIRQEEPLTLIRDQLIYTPNEPDGPIDNDEKTAPAFQLLSDIADQLSVRCWRVQHLALKHRDSPGNPDSPSKFILPLKLNLALVRFHAPGAIRSALQQEK